MKNLLTLLALWSCCLWATAQGIDELPMDSTVCTGQLRNGLTYYIRYNNNPRNRAYFYLAQKVGSVQEEEAERGLAHFLEHMCFNGSEHFEGNGIVEFCRRIGVRFGEDLNAYTSIDRTVYNIDNVPTEQQANLDSCLYILYDWANGLTLSPEEIDKERGVVHEEWRLNSNGIMRVLERQLPALMPGSRYGNRLPIGLMSVVDSFEYDVLRKFYEKWYRPDLQAVIVVGDVDVDTMKQRIAEVFGSIETQTDAEPLVYYAVPDNEEPIIVADSDKEITQPILLAMFKHDALPRDYRATAMAVPMNIVSMATEQMMGYRFAELMENPAAPYVMIGMDDSEFLLTRSVEAFNFEVVPKEGRTEEAARALLREIVRLREYGFGEEEYERFKLDLDASLEQGLLARKTVGSATLVEECVNHFIDNESLADYEYETGLYRQFLEVLPLETINAYAQEVVGRGDTNVVILAAFPDKEEYPLPRREELKAWLAEAGEETVEPYAVKPVDTQLLEYEPTPGMIVNLLEADERGYKGLKLDNGVEVYYKQTDYEEANIRVAAVSKGGATMVGNDDIDNLMVFNSVMQGNGLGRFSSNELRKALTGKNVSLSIALGDYTESLTGSTAPKDLQTLMQLIYLSFTNLNYDTLNYHTTMQATRQALQGRQADPMTPLRDSLLVCRYGNSPRYQPQTVERLEGVDYDALRRIYSERFGNAADFKFVFTGNIREDSLRFYAARYLGALPTEKTREETGDDGVRLWKGKKRSNIRSKMETPAGYLIQVWHGKAGTSIKDRITAAALGSLLTEEYLRTVREEASFAYWVGSSVGVQTLPEKEFHLVTQCPVQPEKADSALLLIDEGLNKMATVGPTPEQLAKVKEQMLKDLEVNLRDNAFWESVETAALIYGVDLMTGRREAIEGLTAEKIRKFAAKTVLASGNRYDFILLPEE